MQGRHLQHKVLTDVYYIPKLKSNIVSLGQLEEKGFKVVLENGKMCVYDQERALIIAAPRAANRLYTVIFGVVPPVCLLAKFDDEAWRWHARFGHLNFRALRDLSCKRMVDGMPTVNRVEQICDGCVLVNNIEFLFHKLQTIEQKRDCNLFMLIYVVTSLLRLQGGAHIFC